jgi:flagellar motility protein MotE (MotC chaperone)
MNLKLKDYIILGLVTVLSFPVVYFAIMLWTGMMRIEFGPKDKPEEEKVNVEVMKFSERKDSITASHSRAFQALVQEKADMEQERKRLQEQQQRVDLSQQELENERKIIQEERKKLEALVLKSDSLDRKKVKELAKVYGAMKAAEAAQIIETLNDKMAADVISAISDERQKGKILAALSTEKASSISKIIGAKP